MEVKGLAWTRRGQKLVALHANGKVILWDVMQQEAVCACHS